MEKNQNFELFKDKIPKFFGGRLLKGNAKRARPLSTKHAIHLVLKSDLARGSRSFLGGKNVKRIDAIVRAQAKKAGVRIYHFVNVGNHIHLVIRLHSRRSYALFIRPVTGLIARQVLGAERNSPQIGSLSGNKFWQARPFTRLVNWGRDYDRIKGYMEKNRTQAQTRSAFNAWGFDVLDPDKIFNLDTA